MLYYIYGVLLLLLTDVIQISLQHGMLVWPPQRGSLWRHGYGTPENNNDGALYCGGIEELKRSEGKCGVCGDPFYGPRDHEAGGKYANGIIVGKFDAGVMELNVTVKVTGHDKGYFEFRICPHNNPDVPVQQSCLDKHLLEIEGGDSSSNYTRYYQRETTDLNGEYMYILTLRMPVGISCSQCVLQWRYVTGNSWGVGKNGTSCQGCGLQEEFRNCADISIGDTRSNDMNNPISPGIHQDIQEYNSTANNQDIQDNNSTVNNLVIQNKNATVDNQDYNSTVNNQYIQDNNSTKKNQDYNSTVNNQDIQDNNSTVNNQNIKEYDSTVSNASKQDTNSIVDNPETQANKRITSNPNIQGHSTVVNSLSIQDHDSIAIKLGIQNHKGTGKTSDIQHHNDIVNKPNIQDNNMEIQDHNSVLSNSQIQDQYSIANSPKIQDHIAVVNNLNIQDHGSIVYNSDILQDYNKVNNPDIKDHNNTVQNPVIHNHGNTLNDTDLQDLDGVSNNPNKLEHKNIEKDQKTIGNNTENHNMDNIGSKSEILDHKDRVTDQEKQGKNSVGNNSNTQDNSTVVNNFGVQDHGDILNNSDNMDQKGLVNTTPKKENYSTTNERDRQEQTNIANTTAIQENRNLKNNSGTHIYNSSADTETAQDYNNTDNELNRRGEYSAAIHDQNDTGNGLDLLGEYSRAIENYNITGNDLDILGDYNTGNNAMSLDYNNIENNPGRKDGNIAGNDPIIQDNSNTTESTGTQYNRSIIRKEEEGNGSITVDNSDNQDYNNRTTETMRADNNTADNKEIPDNNNISNILMVHGINPGQGHNSFANDPVLQDYNSTTNSPVGQDQTQSNLGKQTIEFGLTTNNNNKTSETSPVNKPNKEDHGSIGNTGTNIKIDKTVETKKDTIAIESNNHVGKNSIGMVDSPETWQQNVIENTIDTKDMHMIGHDSSEKYNGNILHVKTGKTFDESRGTQENIGIEKYENMQTIGDQNPSVNDQPNVMNNTDSYDLINSRYQPGLNDLNNMEKRTDQPENGISDQGNKSVNNMVDSLDNQGQRNIVVNQGAVDQHGKDVNRGFQDENKMIQNQGVQEEKNTSLNQTNEDQNTMTLKEGDHGQNNRDENRGNQSQNNRTVSEGDYDQNNRAVNKGDHGQNNMTVNEGDYDQNNMTVNEGDHGQNNMTVNEGDYGQSNMTVNEGDHGQNNMTVNEGDHGQNNMTVNEGDHGQNNKTVNEGDHGQNNMTVNEGDHGQNNMTVNKGDHGQNNMTVNEGDYGQSNMTVNEGDHGQNNMTVNEGDHGQNNMTVNEGDHGQNNMTVNKGDHGQNNMTVNKGDHGQNNMTVNEGDHGQNNMTVNTGDHGQNNMTVSEGDHGQNNMTVNEGDHGQNNMTVNEGDHGQNKMAVNEGDHGQNNITVKKGDHGQNNMTVNEGDHGQNNMTVNEGDHGQNNMTVNEGDYGQNKMPINQGDQDTTIMSVNEGDQGQHNRAVKHDNYDHNNMTLNQDRQSRHNITVNQNSQDLGINYGKKEPSGHLNDELPIPNPQHNIQENSITGGSIAGGSIVNNQDNNSLTSDVNDSLDIQNGYHTTINTDRIEENWYGPNDKRIRTGNGTEGAEGVANSNVTGSDNPSINAEVDNVDKIDESNNGIQTDLTETKQLDNRVAYSVKDQKMTNINSFNGASAFRNSPRTVHLKQGVSESINPTVLLQPLSDVANNETYIPTTDLIETQNVTSKTQFGGGEGMQSQESSGIPTGKAITQNRLKDILVPQTPQASIEYAGANVSVNSTEKNTTSLSSSSPIDKSHDLDIGSHQAGKHNNATAILGKTGSGKLEKMPINSSDEISTTEIRPSNNFDRENSVPTEGVRLPLSIGGFKLGTIDGTTPITKLFRDVPNYDSNNPYSSSGNDGKIVTPEYVIYGIGQEKELLAQIGQKLILAEKQSKRKEVDNAINERQRNLTYSSQSAEFKNGSDIGQIKQSSPVIPDLYQGESGGSLSDKDPNLDVKANGETALNISDTLDNNTVIVTDKSINAVHGKYSGNSKTNGFNSAGNETNSDLTNENSQLQKKAENKVITDIPGSLSSRIVNGETNVSESFVKNAKAVPEVGIDALSRPPKTETTSFPTLQNGLKRDMPLTNNGEWKGEEKGLEIQSDSPSVKYKDDTNYSNTEDQNFNIPSTIETKDKELGRMPQDQFESHNHNNETITRSTSNTTESMYIFPAPTPPIYFGQTTTNPMASITIDNNDRSTSDSIGTSNTKEKTAKRNILATTLIPYVYRETAGHDGDGSTGNIGDTIVVTDESDIQQIYKAENKKTDHRNSQQSMSKDPELLNITENQTSFYDQVKNKTAGSIPIEQSVAKHNDFSGMVNEATSKDRNSNTLGEVNRDQSETYPTEEIYRDQTTVYPIEEINLDQTTTYPTEDVYRDQTTVYPVGEVNLDQTTSYPVDQVNRDQTTTYPVEEVNRDQKTSYHVDQVNRDQTTAYPVDQVNLDQTTAYPVEEANLDQTTAYPVEEVNRDRTTTYPVEEVNRDQTTTYPEEEVNLDRTTTYPEEEVNRDRTTTYPVEEANLDQTTAYPVEEVNRDRTTTYPVEEVNQDQTTTYPVEEVNLDQTTTYPVEEVNLDQTTTYPVEEVNQDQTTAYPVGELNRDQTTTYPVEEVNRDQTTAYPVGELNRDQTTEYSVGEVNRDQTTSFSVDVIPDGPPLPDNSQVYASTLEPGKTLTYTFPTLADKSNKRNYNKPSTSIRSNPAGDSVTSGMKENRSLVAVSSTAGNNEELSGASETTYEQVVPSVVSRVLTLDESGKKQVNSNVESDNNDSPVHNTSSNPQNNYTIYKPTVNSLPLDANNGSVIGSLSTDGKLKAEPVVITESSSQSKLSESVVGSIQTNGSDRNEGNIYTITGNGHNIYDAVTSTPTLDHSNNVKVMSSSSVMPLNDNNTKHDLAARTLQTDGYNQSDSALVKVTSNSKNMSETTGGTMKTYENKDYENEVSTIRINEENEYKPVVGTVSHVDNKLDQDVNTISAKDNYKSDTTVNTMSTNNDKNMEAVVSTTNDNNVYDAADKSRLANKNNNTEPSNNVILTSDLPDNVVSPTPNDYEKKYETDVITRPSGFGGKYETHVGAMETYDKSQDKNGVGSLELNGNKQRELSVNIMQNDNNYKSDAETPSSDINYNETDVTTMHINNKNEYETTASSALINDSNDYETKVSPLQIADNNISKGADGTMESKDNNEFESVVGTLSTYNENNNISSNAIVTPTKGMSISESAMPTYRSINGLVHTTMSTNYNNSSDSALITKATKAHKSNKPVAEKMPTTETETVTSGVSTRSTPSQSINDKTIYRPVTASAQSRKKEHGSDVSKSNTIDIKNGAQVGERSINGLNNETSTITGSHSTSVTGEIHTKEKNEHNSITKGIPIYIDADIEGPMTLSGKNSLESLIDVESTNANDGYQPVVRAMPTANYNTLKVDSMSANNDLHDVSSDYNNQGAGFRMKSRGVGARIETTSVNYDVSRTEDLGTVNSRLSTADNMLQSTPVPKSANAGIDTDYSQSYDTQSRYSTDIEKIQETPKAKQKIQSGGNTKVIQNENADDLMKKYEKALTILQVLRTNPDRIFSKMKIKGFKVSTNAILKYAGQIALSQLKVRMGSDLDAYFSGQGLKFRTK